MEIAKILITSQASVFVSIWVFCWNFPLKGHCTYQTCWLFLEEYSPLIQDLLFFFGNFASCRRYKPPNVGPLGNLSDAFFARRANITRQLPGRRWNKYFGIHLVICGQFSDALSDFHALTIFSGQSADAWEFEPITSRTFVQGTRIARKMCFLCLMVKLSNIKIFIRTPLQCSKLHEDIKANGSYIQDSWEQVGHICVKRSAIKSVQSMADEATIIQFRHFSCLGLYISLVLKVKGLPNGFIPKSLSDIGTKHAFAYAFFGTIFAKKYYFCSIKKYCPITSEKENKSLLYWLVDFYHSSDYTAHMVLVFSFPHLGCWKLKAPLCPDVSLILWFCVAVSKDQS